MEAAQRSRTAPAAGEKGGGAAGSARDKLSFVCAWMTETPREPFSRCAQERNLGPFVHEICLIYEFLSPWECPEKVACKVVELRNVLHMFA